MLYIKTYNSPLGIIYMKSDGEYLTELSFKVEKENDYINKDLKIFKETSKWLDLYFSGKEPKFRPKYKIQNLTPFRKKVINIINEIPYGKTITYGDIAKKIDNNKKLSAQAVGQAVGFNPICIIIPCHRVVGKNNNLTGYKYGISKKIKLLELENHNIEKFKIPKKEVSNE